MKFLCPLLLLFSFSTNAQYAIKVKKEDNRFLFFQLGTKSDTIIKNKSDLFLIKLPDSLKNNIQIFLKNGQFIETKKDSIYRLRSVPGMKYSHSKPDSVFQTLVEGNCPPSKIITIEFINTHTQKRILQNNFIVK
ncbi:MAG: hypothetical protein H7141_09065 [Burkholderiales bacterium]|nr:hypothetical protein [Bacteroidia bacterium]